MGGRKTDFLFSLGLAGGFLALALGVGVSMSVAQVTRGASIPLFADKQANGLWEIDEGAVRRQTNPVDL